VLALAEELGLPFVSKFLSYGRVGGYDLGRINRSGSATILAG
jgi:hypothetical protein